VVKGDVVGGRVRGRDNERWWWNQSRRGVFDLLVAQQ